jgi:hypothetical protein
MGRTIADLQSGGRTPDLNDCFIKTHKGTLSSAAQFERSLAVIRSGPGDLHTFTHCLKKIDIREKSGIGRADDSGDPIPWLFREEFGENTGKNVGDNIAVVCHGASTISDLWSSHWTRQLSANVLVKVFGVSGISNIRLISSSSLPNRGGKFIRKSSYDQPLPQSA